MRELKKLFLNKAGIEVYKAVLPPVGVNSYVLVKDNYLLIVDPGMGIAEIVESFILEGKKVSILLTHSHFDHIAGIDELQNAEILGKSEVLDGLDKPEINLSGMFGGPELVIQNKNFMMLEDEKNEYGPFIFKAIYFPGHTAADTVFDFDDFIITGDFIFTDSIGRTDFPHSDDKKMRESLTRFRKYLSVKSGNTLILPGHMGYCDVKSLFENNFYLSMY
ncbi:MAG TPA: MBL fold metallo-hydrolase [Thermotogota bacterium]|nr:MBL fold metallo-hydrolase [Thermotogota bacterium]HPJ87616.1 MBL fold metallo-hydrolase [Thermotogota bacterium]HPR94821.1 MBL fold metallo-hydrolase [Thermotogota bacterium]